MKKLSAIDKSYEENEFPNNNSKFVQLFMKYAKIIEKEADIDLPNVEMSRSDGQSLSSH